MTEAKGIFFVYVNHLHEHLVMEEGQLADAETLRRVNNSAWRLLWDSAPTAFAGAKYAAENYDCPVPCLPGEPRHPLTVFAVPRGPAAENDYSLA